MSESTPSLFRRALESVAKASNLPTLDDATQELVDASLRDLSAVDQRVKALSLFSANETLEDLGTKSMVYLFVDYAIAEVINGARVSSGPEAQEERVRRLGVAQRHMQQFLDHLRNFGVVLDEDRQLYTTNLDPSARREMKIKQFKKEREIKDRINALQSQRLIADPDPSSDYELIATLLPSSATDDDDTDDPEQLRELTLLLLRLCWAKATTSFESMKQEGELLRSMPPPESRGPPPMGRKAEDDATWRLDPSDRRGGPDGKGPLLDQRGRPLRPFTIVSTMATERERLRSEVFRPDHRLPTMTIDEYLAEEDRRGNIIRGGGQASLDAPTRKEQLITDSEMDGTWGGEEKAEEKRREDEQWAQYTDDNPKGAGNTINRG